MLQITKKKIPVSFLLNQIKIKNTNIGALVSFVGYVRDFSEQKNENLHHLKIEHYEGMTEKKLFDIVLLAKKKWDITDSFIIHRVGKISLNEVIVFIAVVSKHRDDAFDACRFIIDYLKTEAPLWKKEVSKNQSIWVEQKESDLDKVK